MFNPDRLILAKRRRRLTGKALAEKAGVSPVTISRIEAGLNQPEEETVRALSDVLDFPLEFFYGDILEEPPKEAASFRSLTAMTARERDAALAAGSLAYLLSDWVDTRFNLPSPNLIDFSEERNASKAARALRQQWGLGEQPIGNMIKLLESKGIRVFSLAENTKTVDAFSCWRNEKAYVFLNTMKSAERSRFDAAHELGHLVLHKHGGPEQGKAAELEAQQFAASFLMPEADLRSKIPRALSLDQMVVAKRRWGVSVMALAYRLNRLKILSDWLYRGIVIEGGRRGYREDEPNSMEREESTIWKMVLGELWAEKVTKSHIAHDLMIPLAELENLLFGLTDRNSMSFTDASLSRPKLHIVK